MTTCDFCKAECIGCLVHHAVSGTEYHGEAHKVCTTHVHNPHPILGGGVTFVSNRWVRNTPYELGAAIATGDEK